MEEIVLQGRAELCGGGLPPAHPHLVPGRGGETGGSLLVRENRLHLVNSWLESLFLVFQQEPGLMVSHDMCLGL